MAYMLPLVMMQSNEIHRLTLERNELEEQRRAQLVLKKQLDRERLEVVKWVTETMKRFHSSALTSQFIEAATTWSHSIKRYPYATWQEALEAYRLARDDMWRDTKTYLSRPRQYAASVEQLRSMVAQASDDFAMPPPPRKPTTPPLEEEL